MEEFEKRDGEYLYNVYVILLDDAAGRTLHAKKHNPNRHPSKPCIYVGATIYDPEKRFKQHLEGHKASRWVRKYGIRLMPELYRDLERLPESRAFELESRYAEELRSRGYTVFGGH